MLLILMYILLGHAQENGSISHVHVPQWYWYLIMYSSYYDASLYVSGDASVENKCSLSM